jgi:hypothetical protein
MSEESFDILVSSDSAVTAGSGPCWEGYKQVGMKKGKDGKMVPNCVPVDASDNSNFAAKGKRTISQTPAPAKDRIKGSSRAVPKEPRQHAK